MFWKCFLPDYVHFCNDGPLGMQKSAWLDLPRSFFGQWFDINSIGWSGGASLPDADSFFRWMFGPVGYAAFFIPFCLFILGAGAYFFFSRAGMAPVASVLGGLAACFTTNYFSDGCWGAAPAVFAFGMDFFAMGALIKRDKLPFWVAPALAGLAVGINVVESADIGVLFSLLIAAFVLYHSIVAENGAPLIARACRGVGRIIVVAVFAVFIAAYGIMGILGISVKGVAGTQQDTTSKAAKWDFATQWSLPKRETLSLIVPGLFGYRIDFRDDRAYWGGMGQDASWYRFYHEALLPGDAVAVYIPGEKVQQPEALMIGPNGDLPLPSVVPSVKASGLTRFELQRKISEAYAGSPAAGAVIEYANPRSFQRHTGRGFYFGLLVVIVGIWAAFQSFRKDASVFTPLERKLIWFWVVVSVISLVLAHGKFSPFAGLYYWIYCILPYSSSVRSPEKFLHLMNFAFLILFGYGINGIHRRYLAASLSNVPVGTRLKNWWAKAPAFDRRWVIGSGVAIIIAIAGSLTYFALRGAVEQYLQDIQFDKNLAAAVSARSLTQVGWFVIFLVADCGLLLLIFSGAFAGRRAVWGGVLLGVLLVGDLARADAPYIVFWNYKQKYETDGPDPIVKFLADKPYEHRVANLPFEVPEQFSLFQQLYSIEWVQQLFPYYNVQTLDIAQLARPPLNLEAFNLSAGLPGTPPWTRMWELSNTRYLVGPAGYLDVMNSQLDPAMRRFQIVATFRVEPKPGIEHPVDLSQLTAVPSQQGEYALFEFKGALPRVKLFSNWETNTPADFKNFTTNGLSSLGLGVFQMTDTNSFLTLKKLMSPTFDPAQTVLVDDPVPAPAASSGTNQNAGGVEFASYNSTDIKLKANAPTSTVLLLNDRYDPTWTVRVDGKPAELLHCNYVMRGVYLPPGQHDVEFKFAQDVRMLYVNVAAILVGCVLLCYAMVTTRKQGEEETAPETIPAKAK